MRDARQIKSVEALEPDLHVERGQIIVDVGEAGLRQFALRFLLILVRALPIRFGISRRLEEVQLRDRFQIELRIVGQFRNDDFRQEFANDIPLEWIVIKKHKRVEADVQGLLDC